MLSAMLDDTMGPAVLVMSEGRLYTTTISMTVNFLGPARPGPIIGEAKVTQLGKTIAFVEAKLMAEDGTVLATASASERLLEAARVVGNRPAAYSSSFCPLWGEGGAKRRMRGLSPRIQLREL